MEIEQLNISIDQMISYMKLKIEQRDWHAVADAAMDIREMEAKKQVYLLLGQKFIVPSDSGVSFDEVSEKSEQTFNSNCINLNTIPETNELLRKEIEKLQAKNKKLRECVYYYANPFNNSHNPANDFNFDFAIQTLKEVGE
jgi:hypothetical protein